MALIRLFLLRPGSRQPEFSNRDSKVPQGAPQERSARRQITLDARDSKVEKGPTIQYPAERAWCLSKH